MSPRTEESYVKVITEFMQWIGWTEPAKLTAQQVTDYLSYLAVERKVAASTRNVAFSALLFLLRRVLERDIGGVKRPALDILTKRELAALLKRIDAKYLPILESLHCEKDARKLSKAKGIHPNSVMHAVKLAGGCTVQTIKRSMLLHEIADGAEWKAVEAKYGAHSVKTACADFVKRFGCRRLSRSLD